LLAAACRARTLRQTADAVTVLVEGVANTPGEALFRAPRAPRSVLLAGKAPDAIRHDAQQGLLWVRFANQPAPRELSVQY
jgi:hypothetical protein